MFMQDDWFGYSEFGESFSTGESANVNTMGDGECDDENNVRAPAKDKGSTVTILRATRGRTEYLDTV